MLGRKGKVPGNGHPYPIYRIFAFINGMRSIRCRVREVDAGTILVPSDSPELPEPAIEEPSERFR